MHFNGAGFETVWARQVSNPSDLSAVDIALNPSGGIAVSILHTGMLELDTIMVPGSGGVSLAIIHYDENGIMENPGFLDYRAPVASDVSFEINTEIIEVPNPHHPYGIRGIGEVSIIPPLAAIANAIYGATGVRFYDHPMSPPKILKALKANKIVGAAE